MNHADEAERLLTDSREQGNAGLKSLALRAADVHATLALVEQQRIANLLTFARFDHTGEDKTRLFTDLAFAVQLRNEAGIALGL